MRAGPFSFNGEKAVGMAWTATPRRYRKQGQTQPPPRLYGVHDRRDVEVADFETVRSSVDLLAYCEARGLEKRGRGMYVCPVCGSGNGPRRTAAFHVQGQRWKCFSCNSGGDVFDLVGVLDGIENKRDQLQAVAEWAGLDADLAPKTAAAPQPKPKHDYSTGRKREADYLQAMRANINDPEAVAYIQGRGFTMEEAVAFGLGYDPNAGGAKDEDGNWCERGRIVIPWPGSDYYHIDRSTDPRADEKKYMKPKEPDVGPQPLYDPEATQEAAFFIVEGALDALAVRACGYRAVALGGTGARAAVEAMTARRCKGVAIVMLDSDQAGTKASDTLTDLLAHAGIPQTMATTKTKDAAEWLESDREGLRAFLTAEHVRAVQMAEELREAAYNDALGRLRVLNPRHVAESLYLLEDAREPIPTGFDSLDGVLGGGLQPGLYVLGAVSSLGKTTLCVQMADYIATQGVPCLFVTIEQSAREITAKSLSRIMSACGLHYSTTDVSSPTRRSAWSTTDYERFRDACNRYTSEVAPFLRILEGNKQPTVQDVRNVAETMADHDGQAPVVFLDYLQLLAPVNERDSDKQTTDRNVMALRQMARDLQTPVFVVSSLNRSSYSEGVTMDAFKESGAIEYGSDVLLGLQPKGMREHMAKVGEKRTKREADKFIRENKSKDPRECELFILKNRAGRTPDDGLPFTFKPVASTFREGK